MITDNETSEFNDETGEISTNVVEAGRRQIRKKRREHTSTSPMLSGGDVDAAWEDDDIGEESVGGGNPTPDQDIVEELGQAMGVTFEDNEPLDFAEKLEKRDRDRWELDPASADDFSS